MKVLLAGNMARDAVMAERLAQEGCELHIAASIRNPNLVDATTKSEGRFYPIADVADPREVARVAQAAQVDLFVTNSDEALANGVVDAVVAQAPNTLMASPDRLSAQLEWDKFEARDIIAELDEVHGTSYNPLHIAVKESREVLPALSQFRERDMQVVIKPPGLTGGKGVKVMGPHLADYDAVERYALEVLSDSGQDGLLMEQKLEGHEFTIQGLTDGITLIVPPPTYDYPYREDGDEGPGTGGMGSFTPPPGEQLPFLTGDDYVEAMELMRHVLGKQRERGHDFKGVLYGSFFKTAEGLKVVEFNARMGDPEGINIVELLAEDTPLHQVLRKIATQALSERDVRFKRMASTALYLVAPEYAYGEAAPIKFEIDPAVMANAGCRIYFGAAERIGLQRYRTVGTSRTVALASRARTPWEARAQIHDAIEEGVKGLLHYRRDVADPAYIKLLR